MNKILICAVFLIPLLLNGQKNARPVSVSLINESTAIPFTRFITTPIHPGIQGGTEFNYRERESSRIFQTVNLNYFYHNHLAQGIGLNTEFGYEYRLKSGFAFASLLGLGYLHTFATAEEYDLKDGTYNNEADNGNARIVPSLSLQTGYFLSKSNVKSPEIFLRYQCWIEYPYSPDFIPLMTHINLHIGVKFFIHSKSAGNE